MKNSKKHPISHPASNGFKEYTTADALNDMIEIIPTIVTDDPTITIQTIRTELKMKHFIVASIVEVQKAIDTITGDHLKSFVMFDQVMKGHGIHMNRFVMLVTKHRMIKSCHRVITAGNGAKYSVVFYADNGAKLKTWFGVQMANHQISYGVEHLCHSVVKFDVLENRAEMQSSTIAWLLDEFPEMIGMKMAAQLIKDFKITMDVPTPDRMSIFNGFHCVGTLIGGSTINGTINVPQTSPEHATIDGAIIHPWNQIKSITISVQY